MSDRTAARRGAPAEDGSGLDGTVVYGVRTTRIYCRPGCPSRRPKPGNVVWFGDPSAAKIAGFRPCRRCRPDETVTGQSC